MKLVVQSGLNFYHIFGAMMVYLGHCLKKLCPALLLYLNIGRYRPLMVKIIYMTLDKGHFFFKD